MSDTAGETLDNELQDIREHLQGLADFTSDMDDRIDRLENKKLMDNIRVVSETDVFVEKSYELEEESGFKLSIKELATLEALMRTVPGFESDLRVKLWNEVLVRKAMDSMPDRRPVEDLTFLQKEGRSGAL